MNKKEMYNRIMTDVAKIVKKRLHESMEVTGPVLFKKNGLYCYSILLKDFHNKVENKYVVKGSSILQLCFNYSAIANLLIDNIDASFVIGPVKAKDKTFNEINRHYHKQFEKIFNVVLDDFCSKFSDDFNAAEIETLEDFIGFLDSYEYPEVEEPNEFEKYFPEI